MSFHRNANNIPLGKRGDSGRDSRGYGRDKGGHGRDSRGAGGGYGRDRDNRRGGGGYGRDSRGAGGRDHRRRGADKLAARIKGTDDTEGICPFYLRVGSCRHGDRCSRKHPRPAFSQTIEIPHMYLNPLALILLRPEMTRPTDAAISKQFDNFYREVWEEASKFGHVEDIIVCDNLCDHLVGNVYIKYTDEMDAAKAKESFENRYYEGRKMSVRYCPVTNFDEARCRRFDENCCNRGAYCNFLHVTRVKPNTMFDLRDGIYDGGDSDYSYSDYSYSDDYSYSEYSDYSDDENMDKDRENKRKKESGKKSKKSPKSDKKRSSTEKK